MIETQITIKTSDFNTCHHECPFITQSSYDQSLYGCAIFSGKNTKERIRSLSCKKLFSGFLNTYQFGNIKDAVNHAQKGRYVTLEMHGADRQIIINDCQEVVSIHPDTKQELRLMSSDYLQDNFKLWDSI